MTVNSGERDRSAQKQTVWRIMQGIPSMMALTPVMVRRAIFLGGEDERRQQLHAAGLLVSRCAPLSVGGNIESYHELLSSRHTLEKATDGAIRAEAKSRIRRHDRAGSAYEDILVGIKGWQLAFDEELMHPLEMDIPEGHYRADEPPLKLDHVALLDIIDRTDPPEHPAIQRAEYWRKFGRDAATRDAFHMASHLLRFVSVQPPLGWTVETT